MTGTVYLICGKIAAGKTTYSHMLAKAKKAVLLSTDEITLAIFGQHIGEKHDEVVESVQNYLFEKSLEILENGINVLLDWGFWLREERDYAREYYSSRGIQCEFHYIDVSHDTWMDNIAKRNQAVIENRTSAYYVDDNLAKKFESIFEEPERSEIDIWYTLDRLSGAPAPELWDLYDKNHALTGQTHIRGEKLPEGRYHMVVHVWITDGSGNYLISRRSLSRYAWPGKYETVGGSCIIWETSHDGALREAMEETGVDLSHSSGRIVLCEKRSDNFLDAWLFEYKGEIDLSKATTDEVMELKWMSADEICRLFDAGMFCDTLKYFFDRILGAKI